MDWRSFLTIADLDFEGATVVKHLVSGETEPKNKKDFV